MPRPTLGTWPANLRPARTTLSGMVAGLTIYALAIVAVWAVGRAKGADLPLRSLADLDVFYPAAEALSTMAFAVSGSFTVSRDKGRDDRGGRLLTAFLVAGMVTGVGGGIVRDLVFLTRRPVVLSDPGLLAMAALGSLVGPLLASSTSALIEPAVDTADYVAVGLMGVLGFAIAGSVAPHAPDPATHCIAALVAMVTSCGGGLVRDVVRRKRPFAFMGCYLLIAISAATIHAVIHSAIPSGTDLDHPESLWFLTALAVTAMGIATRRIVL